MKAIVNILLASTLLTVSSCSYYYVPNSHNVPMFRQAGDVRVNGGYFFANGLVEEASKGAELQAAFSPVNHIGLAINYQHNSSPDSADVTSKGHLLEGAIGFYQRVGNKATFETYAGAGGGKTQFFNPNPETPIKLFRFFVQPAIGYTSDFFDGIFSLRFAYVHQKYETGQAYYGDKYFLEPAITLRGGWRFAKFQTQFGFSKSLSNNIDGEEDLLFRVGIGLSFALEGGWLK